MTKQELVETVQRELDASFALPSQLQPSEIERLIDQTSVCIEFEFYTELPPKELIKSLAFALGKKVIIKKIIHPIKMHFPKKKNKLNEYTII